MRPGPYKPDSITCLFVFVVLGMLLTTLVKADDDVFAQQPSVSLRQAQDMATPSKPKQLWSFASGVSTGFDGGMAHVRIDSQQSNTAASLLPKNTRFVFSMGVEDNNRQQLLERQSVNTGADWYESYEPTMYLTIGHSW